LFSRTIVTGSGKHESEGCQSMPVFGQFVATAASPRAIKHRRGYSSLTCQGSGVRTKQPHSDDTDAEYLQTREHSKYEIVYIFYECILSLSVMISLKPSGETYCSASSKPQKRSVRAASVSQASPTCVVRCEVLRRRGGESGAPILQLQVRAVDLGGGTLLVVDSARHQIRAASRATFTGKSSSWGRPSGSPARTWVSSPLGHCRRVSARSQIHRSTDPGIPKFYRRHVLKGSQESERTATQSTTPSFPLSVFPSIWFSRAQLPPLSGRNSARERAALGLLPRIVLLPLHSALQAESIHP